MRKKSKKQMPLMPETIDHPQAVELENISRILDAVIWRCKIFLKVAKRPAEPVLAE